MIVHLTPSQEAQLSQIAAQYGQGADELAQQLFERYLKYEAAEAKALDLGIKQADRGDLIDHADVVTRFEKF